MLSLSDISFNILKIQEVLHVKQIFLAQTSEYWHMTDVARTYKFKIRVMSITGLCLLKTTYQHIFQVRSICNYGLIFQCCTGLRRSRVLKMSPCITFILWDGDWAEFLRVILPALVENEDTTLLILVTIYGDLWNRLFLYVSVCAYKININLFGLIEIVKIVI